MANIVKFSETERVVEFPVVPVIQFALPSKPTWHWGCDSVERHTVAVSVPLIMISLEPSVIKLPLAGEKEIPSFACL